MISRWGFTLRKADRLVRRFAEVPKNNINFGSFVHEYVEAPTSAHIKEEFAKHYTKATDGEMWKGSASLEGTDMYAARNPDILPAYYRKNFTNEVMHSSLSFGTYIRETEMEGFYKLYESMKDSIVSGAINTIDTAPQWAYQRAQRAVGAVLSKLRQENCIYRQELFVTTRVGHVEEDIDSGVEFKSSIDNLINNLKVSQDQIFHHQCFSPAFLEHQIKLSQRNLGLSTLDCVYLHNIETVRPMMSATAFQQLVTRCFETLESQRAKGNIRYYGVASHQGFRCEPSQPGYLSMEELVRLAEKVHGPDHGFRYLTIPVNLTMLEPVLKKSQLIKSDKPNTQELSQVSALQAATQLKLNVMTTQPLMAGYLLQTPLPTIEFLSRYLPVKHLNFVRSLPYDCLKSVTVGMKGGRHNRINCQLSQIPKVEPDVLQAYLSIPKKRTYDTQIKET